MESWSWSWSWRPMDRRHRSTFLSPSCQHCIHLPDRPNSATSAPPFLLPSVRRCRHDRGISNSRFEHVPNLLTTKHIFTRDYLCMVKVEPSVRACSVTSPLTERHEAVNNFWSISLKCSFRESTEWFIVNKVVGLKVF